jgi:hypothetical protein
MRLSDYRDHYYEFSGKASDVARSLAFAGIAVIWVFKKGSDTPRLPRELLVPTTLLVFALACDLLQYVAQTVMWGTFQWCKERELADKTQDPELDAPARLKWPGMVFFVLKLIAVSAGYGFLFSFLVRSLFSSGSPPMPNAFSL